MGQYLERLEYVRIMQARLVDAQEQLMAVTSRLEEQQAVALPEDVALLNEAEMFAKMKALHCRVIELEAQVASSQHSLRSHAVDAVPSHNSSLLNGNAYSGVCFFLDFLLL
jgi:hypothetical protein